MNEETYRELGFNDYLINHLKNYDAKHVLGYRCNTPFHIESSELIEKDIIPLWECGITVTYFNKATNKFEVCNLEEPDVIWVSCSSVQGILAHLLIELLEDEHTDEEISKIGELIGFENTEAMLDEANSAEDYSVWRDEYPAKCC